MAEINQELVQVLARIYFRKLSEPFELKSDHIELINRATGEEIANIAYKNKWKLQTLLINADEMIDEHNERIQRKVLRDLKKLYVDLCTPPRKKQKPPVPIDPEVVDRRILEETINEVIGEVPPVEEEEEFDIEKELERRGILGPGEGFVGVASEPHHNLNTPSLERGQATYSTSAHQIAMHQSTPVDLNMVPELEDFGECSLQELGANGMLQGEFGKQIYNSMKERERFQNARQTTENVPRKSSIPGGRDRSNEMVAHISPKVLKAVRTAANFPLDLDATDNQLNFQEAIALQPSDLVAPDAVALLPIETNASEIAPHNQTGPQEIAVGMQSPARITLTSTNLSRDYSRRELFKQLAIEVEQEKKRQKVANRRQRRRRRCSPSPSPNVTENLALNRPLIRRKRRSKVSKPCHPVDRPSVGSGMYANLELYVEDSPNWGDVPEAEGSANKIISDVQPVMNVPELQITDASQVNVLQLSVTDVQSNAPKRSRLDVPADDRQFLEDPDDDMLPVVRKRITSAAQQPSPLDDFLVQLAAKAAESKKHQLTAEEVELAQLRNSALPAEEIVQVSTIIDNIRRSRLNVTDVQSPIVPYVEKMFQIVDGPCYLGTTRFVNMRNADRSVQRQSAYAMESVALYMQIRFVLARNQWKMLYADLLPQLKLLKPGSERFIENRMCELGQYDFIKLRWDAKEENILEVEIAVR